MSGEANIRFALESSLGKLSKWLRILGFDSIYVPGIPDESFFSYVQEGRIILTRTRKIRDQNPGHRLLFIVYNDPRDQLKQVVSDLDLELSDTNPFSRCIRCNCSLSQISRDKVRSLVPDYVYETRFKFSQCPCCRGIYWPGTHYERSIKMVRELFTRRCF